MCFTLSAQYHSAAAIALHGLEDKREVKVQIPPHSVFLNLERRDSVAFSAALGISLSV